jgi:4-hydroxybenzoyl-CoA thioesterase
VAKTFSKERLIRFSHCDPAGIVYFVNFFDMVGGVVEDWFREAVGLPFQEMHLERRVGFPIVNTGCEFFRPAHLGDTLMLELGVAKLGRSSIEFRVRGSVGGDEKFRARHKVAMVSLDTFRPLAIPPEMRSKMADYVLTEGDLHA